MKKILLLAFCLFASCLVTHAQTITSVSGTIVDPNGIPYSAALITATIVVPSGGVSPYVTATGSPINAPVNSTADGAGHFSMGLYANASITPASTQWNILVQEKGIALPFGNGAVSFNVNFTIAGASPSLTTTLNASAPLLTNFAGGGTGGLTGTLTPGYLPVASGAHVLGNSLCDQGITTANVLTCTDTGGIAIPGVVSPLVNDVVVLSPTTSGTHWTDKVTFVQTQLPCSTGNCTIEAPDNVLDDGHLTNATLGAHVNLHFTGNGAATLCTLNAGQFSHIWGTVTLTASGSNCQLISQTNLTTLQVNYQFLVDGGLTLNGNSQVAATGIYCTLCASTVISNITVTNFLDSTSTVTSPTGGIVFFGSQFASLHDIKFYGNYVDFKCYGLTGAGCNMVSMDHFSSTGFGNSQTPVGLLFLQPVLAAGSGGEVTYGNVCKNCSFLSHSISNVAIFGNTAISSGQSIVHLDGGTTEVTGGGTSVVIDGVTIPKTAVYASYAQVYLDKITDQEATLTPFVSLNNSSIGIVDSLTGYYGGGTGAVTSCDGTSNTLLTGMNLYSGAAETYCNLIASNYAVGGGSANSLTATFINHPGGLYDGLTISVLPAAANTTTTPTLNSDGLGAKTITKFGSAALAASDLTTTSTAQLVYHSASTTWELLNPQTLSSAGGSFANQQLSNLGTTSISATLLSNVACLRNAPCYSFAGAGNSTTGISIFSHDLSLDYPTGSCTDFALNNAVIAAMCATTFNPSDNTISLGGSSARWSNAYVAGGYAWTNGSGSVDTQLSRNAAGIVQVGTNTGNALGTLEGSQLVANGGTGCANGNFALSGGWGSTASVSGAAGFSQTCEITITSSGTGQATGATITWTLPTALPAATTVCTANLSGGTITGLSGTGILADQTTLSATAPVFTFAGLPVTSLTTKFVFRCGP